MKRGIPRRASHSPPSRSARILRTLPGPWAIGRPRGTHAHNSARSILRSNRERCCVHACVFRVCTRPAAHDSNLIKHRAAVAFNCLRRARRLTRRTWHRAREHERRGFWPVNSGMCQTAARRSRRTNGSSCKRVRVHIYIVATRPDGLAAAV